MCGLHVTTRRARPDSLRVPIFALFNTEQTDPRNLNHRSALDTFAVDRCRRLVRSLIVQNRATLEGGGAHAVVAMLEKWLKERRVLVDVNTQQRAIVYDYRHVGDSGAEGEDGLAEGDEQDAEEQVHRLRCAGHKDPAYHTDP